MKMATIKQELERFPARVAAYWRDNREVLLAQGKKWLGRMIFWLFGIIVGLAAVAFAMLTEEASHLFFKAVKAHFWLPFLLTPMATVFLLWLTRKFFVGAEGSGIPQVIAELKRPKEMDWRPLVSLRIVFGKLLIGVAAVGAGLSFGREGPSVQIGAGLMASVARFLPSSLYINRSHLLVAGGAAGIAAAFNAPLAGIIFAIEELTRSVESRMSGVVITAIVLAGVVAQTWLGNKSYFGMVHLAGNTTALAETVLICALFSGIFGGLFSRLLLLSAKGWTGPLATLRSRRPYHFAFACGLFIAALGWASGGETWCSGYEQTRLLLEGGREIAWHFGAAKFVATVVSYLSGLPGGIFAPSLAIGAGIGKNLVPLFSGSVFPATIVVLCMVGFLAAVTQAPITSFVIVMEMVSGYPMVFGLMTCALVASAVSRAVSRPLYPTLAEIMIGRQLEKPLDIAVSPVKEGGGCPEENGEKWQRMLTALAGGHRIRLCAGDWRSHREGKPFDIRIAGWHVCQRS